MEGERTMAGDEWVFNSSLNASFTFHSILIVIQLSPGNTGFLTSGRCILSNMLLPLKHGVGQTSLPLSPFFLHFSPTSFWISYYQITTHSSILVTISFWTPNENSCHIVTLPNKTVNVHFVVVLGDLNIHLDDSSSILILYFLALF